MRKAIVIGSGFSGISAASFLAKSGWDVTVIEKHSGPGGRARQFTDQGFTFDMGPSWYWMPDVFENYFEKLGCRVSDYYKLIRLDPSYRVYWQENSWNIPANYQELKQLFESVETGSGLMLDKFLEEAAFKYETGMKNLVYKPGISMTEFIDADVMKGVLRLDVFTSMRKHVSKFFKDKRLRQLLEFPVLFLGALPEKIPALYSLMNYADIKLGTWYPVKGIYSVVDGMCKLAKELGVTFEFNTAAESIDIDKTRQLVKGISYSKNGSRETVEADLVIASADYNYVEQLLLPESYRNYSQAYWQKKVMAPSCLLFYVGLNKKLIDVEHHSLFFDVDFTKHGNEIYTEKRWPEEPLFYVCTPSVTDSSVAPENHENLFFLIPVASGLAGETEELRMEYFYKILRRFEKLTNQTVKEAIVYLKSYGVKNFVDDYGAFKGNAYGLANTLMQTANLKPSCRNKKLKNLFYTGQLTVPGPGVPPSLISGELVAGLANKYYKVKSGIKESI